MQTLGTILGTENHASDNFATKTVQSTADILQRRCDVVRRAYDHDTEHTSSD